MIIFLASSPDGDLFSDNLGAPGGFDNRNNFADRLRTSLPGKAYFTFFAAYPDDHSGNDSAAEYFAGVFERTGIRLIGYSVCDSRNADEAEALLEKSDVIMLSGGHVPTQNRFFNEINLRNLLKNYSGVIIGVSAGSMNSADTVYAQPEEPGEGSSSEYKKFLPGLGLTEYMIIPHYQLTKDNYLDGRLLFGEITAEDSFGRCFYILVDGSYILIKNGETHLYGEAYTISNGCIKKICEYSEEIKLE